jgi:inner membrane protein involved in colicin E2 resistance
MDKETQIRQGKRAEQLLNDPLLKIAFEDLLEIYKQEIFNTKFAENEKRTHLWVAYNLVEKIRGHLLSIMESGKLTQQELDQLNKRR